jgi:hypothetical protein
LLSKTRVDPKNLKSRNNLKQIIMGVTMLYAAGIREAIASNDLEKMKAVAEQAKQTVREQGDLSSALIELLEAIESLRK